MAEPERLSETALEQLLRKAQDRKSAATLRLHGTPRMLGDLHLRGMEPGRALHLVGAKRRDQLPPAGAEATLTFLLDEEGIVIESRLLDPLVAEEGDTLFPPIIRVAWPERGVRVHRRQDVRVAAPDQSPLTARIRLAGKDHEGLVLNLTETGVGLALAGSPAVELQAPVEVETVLPDGSPFKGAGEVRHFTFLEDNPHPTRLGVVFKALADKDLEFLRRFIQLRRMDRSDTLRQQL